ncbi:MAG TPA: SDR family NAD(P)-dependent oxidoreductase [Dongiaceae bacterium]|nr:SDR family NAD(P)-dependent oxidoreductase [Dongiaceae bacterium]
MNLQGKTIAVTGASGMIGVYICRSLLRAGARVIGVVRNPEKAAFLAQEGVEFRKADLADPAALTQAFTGCDAVVSNAAMYVVQKSMHAWAEHEKANLDGTRNVLEAAHQANVKRVVHISTFGIYKWSIFRTLDEQSPQLNGARRQGGPYRATKQTSEALAWELANRYGIALTTLRPTAVYGARDYNFMRPIYRLLKLPVLPMPSVSFPIVYAGDVANAVAGALGNDASGGQAYNVGGADIQVADFMKALAQVVPDAPKVLALPLPVHVRVDNRKAERDLGFRNRSFTEALREVVAEDPPRKRA